MARVAAAVVAGRERAQGTERWLLGVAALAFVVVFAFGLRAVPSGAVELRWWPFALLALVVVPAVSVANALEYVVAARIAGRRVAVDDAVEVSILSSAANLLPLPGAALVRVRAMRRDGSTYGTALSATALVGAAWLATSLLLAGGLVLVRGGGAGRQAAVGALAVGAVGLVAVAVGVHRLVGAGAGRLTLLLLGAEVLAVAVATVRYLLVLGGLGLGASVEQAVALTVAGVLASALGFVPGGLGLREALAGAIAGIVGLPVATGVLAASVDRLVGLPVLAVLAVAVAVRARRRAGAPDRAGARR